MPPSRTYRIAAFAAFRAILRALKGDKVEEVEGPPCSLIGLSIWPPVRPMEERMELAGISLIHSA